MLGLEIRALALALVLPSLGAIAGECAPVPENLEKAIHSYIAKLKAFEDCSARRIQTSDAITVVIYTAEGACADFPARAKPGTCSNNWTRYMMGFVNHRVLPPLEVGGKGGFTDTAIKIAHGIVEVSGLTLGPNDALCCPSVPETKRFDFSQGGFSEIRP